MKLSHNNFPYSSIFAWVPAYSLEETVRRLARIGYDGIEISAGAPHAWPPYLTTMRRQEVKNLFEEHEITLSSMLPAPGGGPGVNPASPSEEERRWTVGYYKEIAELCAEWGAETLLYIPGWQIFGTTRRQAWAWSREVLGQIAHHAGERGITVVIEPTPENSNLCESCDDAIELMEDVAMPNVKLMFDTCHVFYRREVPTDYVYRMGKDLKHVHLSEIDRLPPGSGSGDWVSLIDALGEVEFDGYLTMEIGFQRGREADGGARLAYQFMKPLVDAWSARSSGAESELIGSSG